MRNNKIIKALCLIFLSVCLAFAAYTPPASAVQYDGSTEVLARIETASSEATQPTADGSSPAYADDSDVSTGDIAFGGIITALVLFLFSALVILVCNRRSDE